MLNYFKLIIQVFLVSLLILFISCEKADIDFEDNGLDDNPEIVEIDNLSVSLGTVKQDSILTSGSGMLLMGTYTDNYLGKISSTTYTEIEYPSDNPLLNKSVILDSICLVLKPTGNFKGDTTRPFKLSVHSLLENIKNENGIDAFYNNRSFEFNSTPLAEASAIIKPSLQKPWQIRLPDALGNEWMQKLVSNADEIQNQDRFRSYFKGLVFVTDSNTNNTMYYFTGDSTALIRLYYKEQGLYNVSKQIDFNFITDKSFYHYDYNYQGTALEQLNPLRKQYFSSSSTDNKAFFSTLAPTNIKFSFPDILTLKERFSDLKIIRALLEIKPMAGSYHYPATLPPEIILNETNHENFAGTYIFSSDGQTPQNGSLVYDPLNNVNTKYVFNITDFINALIEEGQFSTKALLLTGADNILEQSAQLVVNDQSIQKDVKLKIYVLGL
jgi:hypothetical protein